MSDIHVDVANYVQELTGYNSNEIIIGRSNFYYASRKQRLIVVESDQSVFIGKEDKYDGNNEVLTLISYFKQDFTLAFYGDSANDDAHKFFVLSDSQQAKDKMKALDIQAYRPTNIMRMPFKQETEYFSERYQLDFRVFYHKQQNIDTLRIDQANYDLIFNR